jgi:hypothetical protein
MNLGYFLGIPAANNAPRVDQPNMQTNTNSISSLIGVDHVGFNQANGGYHKVIHTTQFSNVANNPPGNNPPNVPARIATIGQLICAQVNQKTNGSGISDEVLIFESGGGRWTQLTTTITSAGNQSLAATSGYTALTGGMIIQWGQGSASNHANNPVSFNIPFPNAAFVVMVNPKSNSPINLSNINGWQVLAFSASGFQVSFGAGWNTPITFNWIAIGN